MLVQLAKQGDWVCLCNKDQVELLQSAPPIDALLEQLRALPVTLKDNHRSSVKRGELLGHEVVAKQPRDKNKRLWARFTSLFGPAESAVTIQNLARLKAAGIPSVAPLFALEKRRAGMVVDSWMCYQYRAGEPCDETGLQEVVQFLDKMHQAGFRHDDPTWNNFLRDDSGRLFTIDTKARPCRGAFGATNDFVLLKRANKLHDLELDSLTFLNTKAFGYWLAIFYMKLKTGRAALRDTIKKNRPKNT